MGDRKLNRRRFIKIAGGVLGAGALAGTGLVTWGLHTPKITVTALDCEKGFTMENKVLIAYASRCGSTAEVAEAVGQVLCEAGLGVDVRNVKDVKDVSSYRAIILGSAARMGKLLPEAGKFLKQHQKALQQKPAAYFMVGTTMNEDTPANRQLAEGYIKPLREIQEPVSVGLFGGKVDHATLGPMWRIMLKHVTEGPMAEGDHRDWDAIRTWAANLPDVFKGA